MSYYYPQVSVELRILPEDFQLTSSANQNGVQRVLVQAKEVTVNVNDYKTTDTFTMEIDYKSFPFDPRTIRACGVVIYMQDMGSIYKDDGTPNTIVPGASTLLDSSVSNGVFLGFVDESNTEFDDGRQVVHFEGRDTTALLIDQKYQANSPIFPNQPLDVALTQLLGAFAATQKIAVVNLTGSTTLPILSSFAPDFGSPLAGGKNPGRKENYWEIIQDLVNRAGLICYMGTTVQSDGSFVPALFLTTPKDQNSNVDDIKFIYGINVKKLSLKRKLGRLKNFNIEVRSRVGKTVITAKIPEQAQAAWGSAFGVPTGLPIMIPVLKPDGSLDTTANTPAPYMAFNVPNIANFNQLVQIGQTTYEQYSLQQLEGTLETTEMLGRGSTQDTTVDQYNTFTQYDLTKIKKGQTICLELDYQDLEAISRITNVTDRANYLVQRGYDQDVATIFATTIGKFSPRFQIKSYSMSMGEEGFKLYIQFQNLIDLNFKNL